MKPLWKSINGLESRYVISNKGKIKNIETGHHVKPYWRKNSKGIPSFYVVKLMELDGRKNTHTLSLLVANHFVKNKNDDIHIIHRDNNKLNCNAWNLRWIDNEVFFWLNDKNNNFAGRNKTYGNTNERIAFLEKKKELKEFEDILLKFYKTQNESYLWNIYINMQYFLERYCRKEIYDPNDIHDIVIDSFMYFIDRCKRAVVNENPKGIVFDCLKDFIRTHHNKKYYTLSPEHLGGICKSESDYNN